VHNLANIIVSCLYVLELFIDICSPIKGEDFILCVETGIVQLKCNVAIAECTNISSALKRQIIVSDKVMIPYNSMHYDIFVTEWVITNFLCT